MSESSPDGITPNQLVGRRLILDFGEGWVVNTGSSLTSQGGKRRIRLTHGAEMHPHLQVAAALMMPHPIRAETPLGTGQPVVRADQYAIEHIEMSAVELLNDDAAQLRIEEVIVRNASYHAEVLGFSARVAQIRQLWDNAAELPAPLSDLIHQHQAVVTSGNPIPKAAQTVVLQLQQVVTETASDFGIVYRTAAEDAVPDLGKTLQAAAVPPEPPIQVEQVPPEEVQIRKRTVKEWKRWANSRGAASAKFRQDVRNAYNSTCVVCGRHLPPTTFNPVPGVEAAHILPWAEYDIDHVSNGLCLCRNHHWAFDEGLIEISYADGQYQVSIPESVEHGLLAEAPEFSVNDLQGCVGSIPLHRLPANTAHHPRPQFLQMLHESS